MPVELDRNHIPDFQRPPKHDIHPSFENLASWAEPNGCLTILQALYWVLGLGPNDPGVANLVTEMEFPESKEILEAWRGVPVVQHLINLREKMNSFPFRRYYTRVHSGSADKTKISFQHLKDKDFLLAMITNPLTDMAGGTRSGGVSPDIFKYRRMLRLWLVLEALHRLENPPVVFDTNISSAARKITIGAESNSWLFIDNLLSHVAGSFRGRLPTFSEFKNALTSFASQFADTFEKRELKLFFNAVKAIGLGTRSSVEREHLPAVIFFPELPLGRTFSFTTELSPGSSWFSDDGQQYELPIFDSDLNDGGELLAGETLFVEVNSGESLTEKALSAKSVYLQTAEASHYLPWSLHSPLPSEISLLHQWIQESLSSSQQLTQMGAAFCWLACHLGRSLQMVRSLPISSHAQLEWTLHPSFQFLHRNAIRRSSAWVPAEHQKSLVAPFEEVLQLDSNPVSQIFKAAAKGLTFDSLGSLWDRIASGTEIETWFRENRPESLDRVNSTQIFNLLGSEVYQNTGDHHLARLVSSHPQSGLPGAVSYASWDIASIEKGMPLKTFGALTPCVHIAGSLLAPLENILIEKIQAANKQLERGGKDLVQWHNHFAEYVVWSLYAATGSRPLADPFETINHFNLEHQFVFINDKNDSGLHAGRITPLPDKAVQLIQAYKTHLEVVSQTLSPIHPELSKEISDLLKGSAKRIPLFFRLDSQLDWQSISVSGSDRLFGWELPENLFRHRYSQHLHKLGVPREVIDGWLGHAERGAATYGDYSPRCWVDDRSKYRDQINEAFESLPFCVFQETKTPPLLINGGSTKNSELSSRVFGQRLREKNHRKRIKQAVAEADAIIAWLDLTTGKEVEEEQLNLTGKEVKCQVKEEQLNLVITKLLKRETGMVHPYAALRFSRLIKLLESKSIDHKLSIRRYAHYSKPEQSMLRSSVSSAINHFDQMAAWAADQMKKKLDPTLPKAEKLLLATMLLVAVKRISYQKLLTDVLQGRHYRVIQHQQSYYIEYSETLDPTNFKEPVQRHRINHRIASLLASGQGVKNPFELTSTLPAIVKSDGQGWLGSEQQTLGQFLEKICAMVDQANQVQLPGMVAAVLSGRVLSSSLPLLDLVRINEGVAKTWPHGIEGQTDYPALNQMTKKLPLAARQPETEQHNLLEQSQIFRQNMTHLIATYEPAKAKEFGKKFHGEVLKYEGRVSNSLLLLGLWISHVITDGKTPGRGKRFRPLAANTVKTYFSNLVGPFTGLAYQVDLLELDSDELTDLYSDMIDTRRDQGHRLDYFSERLLSFQRWAESFGVAKPDYSELRIIDESRSVSAGCLSEQDYHQVLYSINQDYSSGDHKHQDRGLMLAWLMLLCFRFGLRSKEAIWLRFRDFCSYGGYRWILVRNNRKRQLKSDHSRRAVPLAFSLSELEESIVARMLDHYSLIAGHQANELLLSDLDNGQLIPADCIPSLSGELTQRIKITTGNQSMVLHHCRHSFHNRMAAILLNIPGQTAQQLTDGLDGDGIRQLILGKNSEISRRSPAALTCLMGHRYPETGMYSYNHLLLEWADELTPVTAQRNLRITDAFNTSSLIKLDKQRREAVIPLADYATPTLIGLLGVLRRVAQGKTYEQAGQLENLDPSTIRLLQGVFEASATKMRFKIRGKNGFVSGSEYPNALVNYITEKAWRRLLTQARHAPASNLIGEQNMSLDELVSLVGANRQILMRTQTHCQLVRHVVDGFNVSPDHFDVAAYKDNAAATQVLSSEGFVIQTIKSLSQAGKKPFQLDRMGLYRSGHYEEIYHDYAALVLKRNSSSMLRNSYELAVVVLVVGVLLLTAQQ